MARYNKNVRKDFFVWPNLWWMSDPCLCDMSSTYSGRGKVVVYNVITTQQRRERYLLRGEKMKAHHLADGGGHIYLHQFPTSTRKKKKIPSFSSPKKCFFFFLGDESWLKSRRRRRRRRGRRWGPLESARDTHSVFPRKTWNSLDEENPEQKSETGKSEMQLHSPQMGFKNIVETLLWAGKKSGKFGCVEESYWSLFLGGCGSPDRREGRGRKKGRVCEIRKGKKKNRRQAYPIFVKKHLFQRKKTYFFLQRTVIVLYRMCFMRR